MAGYQIKQDATYYPLEVKDVKDYLRLDENEDEIYVRTLIASATSYAQETLNRSLVNRSIVLALDGAGEIELPLQEGMYDGADIPRMNDKIKLPFGNVQSITSIKYYDKHDNEYIFEPSNYYLDNFSSPARVILRDGATWPSSLRDANGLQIEYVSGYGNNPKQVPEQIRVAMLQYIAFLYEHRGDFERFPPPAMPAAINVLLQPYKVYQF